MGRWFNGAKVMRRTINTAASMLTDAQASEVPTLYSSMKYDGELIQSGTRILWGDVLKRAAVDLWDTEDNNPDKSPTLWEDILYRDGIRIIPAIITVGTAFSNGEKGWWGDVLYESIYEGQNTWTPEGYPAGWKVVE